MYTDGARYSGKYLLLTNGPRELIDLFEWGKNQQMHGVCVCVCVYVCYMYMYLVFEPGGVEGSEGCWLREWLLLMLPQTLFHLVIPSRT